VTFVGIFTVKLHNLCGLGGKKHVTQYSTLFYLIFFALPKKEPAEEVKNVKF